MRELYVSIQAELEKIDFEAIWPGFAPIEFILIDDEIICFENGEKPKGSEFFGNTAMYYEGRLVATWNVSDACRADISGLAANIVHEMFHGFQKLEGESRHADEFAIFAYPDNLAAYRIKSAEYRALARAYENADPAALADFIALRRARAEALGDVILDEYKCETTEGLAEYAGLEALRQLSPEKFALRVEKHLGKLKNPGENLFSVRLMTYYSGSILCLVLQKLGIDFLHNLTETRTLFELFANDDPITADFNKYYTDKKSKFDDLLSKPTKIIDKNLLVMGYNPMGMWQMGDQIFAHFICLGKGDETDSKDCEIIQSPMILNINPANNREVISVILESLQ